MNDRSMIIGMAWLASCCFANLIFLPIMEQSNPNDLVAHIGFFIVGVIGAQICVHSIFVALTSYRITLRIAISTFVALSLFVAFVMGLGLAGEMRGDDAVFGMIGFAICLPLLTMSCQLPLWAMRFCFGWHITHTEDPSQSTQATFRLQDVFIGTTFVAISFALAQSGTSLMESSIAPMLIAAACCCGASAMVTLPVVSCLLRNQFVPYRIFFPLSTQIGLVVIFTIVISYFEGRPPTYVYRLLALVVVGFFAATTGCLLMLRHAGWRLQTSKTQSTVRRADNPFQDRLSNEST